MDWTFWVGGAVIVAALIVTQVFLHESRWSRRPRADNEENPGPPVREDPDDRGGPPGSDGAPGSDGN